MAPRNYFSILYLDLYFFFKVWNHCSLSAGIGSPEKIFILKYIECMNYFLKKTRLSNYGNPGALYKTSIKLLRKFICILENSLNLVLVPMTKNRQKKSLIKKLTRIRRLPIKKRLAKGSPIRNWQDSLKYLTRYLAHFEVNK